MYNILAIFSLIIINISTHLYALGYEKYCSNIEKLYTDLRENKIIDDANLKKNKENILKYYKIHKQFSSGAGGASVYWVKDNYDNNKDKVLKIFKAEKFSKEFERNNEAREIYLTCMLHKLNNNYFPIFYDFGYTNVYDLGKAADNKKHLFFVMEFIPGKSLAEHAQERGVFIKDATKVKKALKDVSKALNIAHRVLGFFHNDLHPGNIMINENTNEAKIIDFGLASSKEFYKNDGINQDKALELKLAPKRDYSLVLLNFIKDVRNSSLYIPLAMKKAKDIAKRYPHGDDIQFINMMIYALKNSGLNNDYENLEYCDDYDNCLQDDLRP